MRDYPDDPADWQYPCESLGDFELKRLTNSSPAAREELAKSNDWTDRELFQYMQAFDTEGAKEKQVKTRHKAYRQLFMDFSEFHRLSRKCCQMPII